MIRIPISRWLRGYDMKISRGGAVRNGNSGNGPGRFYAPVRAYRDNKKPGKHGGGRQLPWPPRGAAIWDPRDPFIIAFQAGRK